MVQGAKRIVVVFILVVLSTFSYGQLNNSFFDISRKDTTEGLVSLHIENLGYFRNVEYKSRIDEGRTLFGYQFWPELSYQLGEKAQVLAGLFLQRDFGGEGFYKSVPTFSFQYRLEKHFFRLGTLLGSTQHQLVEPLYDPENVIENRLENGFQHVFAAQHLRTEFWIDWQKMIYQNSPFREEFTAGVAIEPILFNKTTRKLSLPFKLLSFHKGGEIDTSKLPTISNFNFDYGVDYVTRPAGSKWDSVAFQFHALYYEDISTQPVNYIDGLGQYVSIAAYRAGFGAMLNYYDAHQFHNPMGDVVFRTISKRNPTYVFDHRKIAMARLFWQTQLASGLHFLLRANYMRDLRQDSNDVVAEFYVRWNPSFTLGKVK
ncbi:MAG: hypothetical protein JJ975_11090 [Bacteroidia bacterium]|nr:hypothetical protein [Bacteroidia bacterium]